MTELKKTNALFFVGPTKIEIKAIDLNSLEEEDVLVKTELSAISAGSELLIFNDAVPQPMRTDQTISFMKGTFHYPVQYGYSVVGQIIAAGSKLNDALIGKQVFAFHPHQEYFISKINQLFFIPEDISIQNALFLPNLETAVNIVMDSKPLLGEQIILFGQGVVGLLITALLKRFHKITLVTVEPSFFRRDFSQRFAADLVLDPLESNYNSQLKTIIKENDGADLAIEVSGNPDVLQPALDSLGYAGRLVIGSWYGKKKIELNLGEGFHRNKIQIKSSQVSIIPPDLSGRWSKKRRFDLVWQLLRQIKPEYLITHKFPFWEAGKAYELLNKKYAEALQVILTY